MYRNFQNESFQNEISKILKIYISNQNIGDTYVLVGEVLVMHGIETRNRNGPVLLFATK